MVALLMKGPASIEIAMRSSFAGGRDRRNLRDTKTRPPCSMTSAPPRRSRGGQAVLGEYRDPVGGCVDPAGADTDAKGR